MISAPKFITFTGADNTTSIEGMLELSRQYPIEWGILFSPKHQGQGRYPSIPFITKLLAEPMDFAAHLCGGDAREVMEGGASQHEPLLKFVKRVQINTADPMVQPSMIAQWAERVGVRAILQCRVRFPVGSVVDILFDASGGRGIEPSDWPHAPNGQFVGYAGGLGPANVADALLVIGSGATDFWIDMETGIRTNDKFDLSKCRAVCEAVYGQPNRERKTCVTPVALNADDLARGDEPDETESIVACLRDDAAKLRMADHDCEIAANMTEAADLIGLLNTALLTSQPSAQRGDTPKQMVGECASLIIDVENLLDCIDTPPERNCSCHISPPCNDCVEHSALRDAIADVKEAIARCGKAAPQVAQPNAEATSANTLKPFTMEKYIPLKYSNGNGPATPSRVEQSQPAGEVLSDAKAATYDPVCKVVGCDEYGPRLEWRTHWVDVNGETLYRRKK